MTTAYPAVVIGRTRVVRVASDVTVTVLVDGSRIEAAPEPGQGYMAQAIKLGYGTDTARMSYEHELLHVLLADWLGLDESPVLRAVAEGRADRDPNGRLWREEAAVLALQELANAWGVDLSQLQAGGRESPPDHVADMQQCRNPATPGDPGAPRTIRVAMPRCVSRHDHTLGGLGLGL